MFNKRDILGIIEYSSAERKLIKKAWSSKEERRENTRKIRKKLKQILKEIGG